MTTETISPALPAAPPAHDAARAAARWGEAPVRVWMILTLLIGISLASLVARDVSDAVAEEHLMRDGSQAQAVITEIDGTTDPRKTVVTHSGTSDRTVTIKYPDASGEPVENTRELETSRFEGKRVGEAIDIRYNPAHPDEWTRPHGTAAVDSAAGDCVDASARAADCRRHDDPSPPPGATHLAGWRAGPGNDCRYPPIPHCAAIACGALYV